MRKVLVSTALATLLVLPQAAPALAHSTEADVTTNGDAVSLHLGRQEQQASEGPRVVASEDGVVVSLSSHDHDDNRGLLEGILGGFDQDDGNVDGGLLDIFDYDEEENEDARGLFGVFGYDEEDDEDRDGLLGDIL
ncbi:MAG: hypothetical protein M3252_02335 [Actinomycetota bacterium]|nr:hypothetical protein [Actinomycetota bacterium]